MSIRTLKWGAQYSVRRRRVPTTKKIEQPFGCSVSDPGDRTRIFVQQKSTHFKVLAKQIGLTKC